MLQSTADRKIKVIPGQNVSHNQPQHAGSQGAGRSGMLLGTTEQFLLWDKEQLLPCSSNPKQGKDPCEETREIWQLPNCWCWVRVLPVQPTVGLAGAERHLMTGGKPPPSQCVDPSWVLCPLPCTLLDVPLPEESCQLTLATCSRLRS